MTETRGRGLWIPVLAAIALALIVRVAPSTARFTPTPDAVEYWAAARSLKLEGRFTLPLRAYIDDAEGTGPALLAHPAAFERAPLLPLLLAPFCRSPSPSPFLQLLPVLCAALAAGAAAYCAGLIAGELGDESLRRRAAALAGAAAALYPPLFWCSLRLLTEAPSAAFFLGALVLALGREARWRLALSGLIAGLMVLTRPDGVLSAALIGGLLALRIRRVPWFYLGGFAAAALPWWAWACWAYGHPFPAQRFLLRVVSTADVQWNYGAPTRPLSLALILGEAARNLGAYALALLLPKMVSIFPPPALAALRSLRGPARSRGLLLLMALVLILAPAAVWSTRDAMRFPILSGLLLIIVASVELALWTRGKNWVYAGVFVLATGILAARVAKRQRPSSAPVTVWRNPGLEGLAARAPRPTAATNPWAVTLRCQAPALILPNRLNERALAGLLDRFAVQRVFLNPRAPHPGIAEPLEYRAFLEARGWRRAALPGGAEIWSRPD